MVKYIKNEESEILAEALSGILSGDNRTKTRKRPRKYKLKKSFKISVLIVLLLLTSTLLLMWGAGKNKNSPSAQVSAILKEVSSFKPYYISPHNTPEGVDPKSITAKYDAGILFITMTASNGQTITVTQQPVPSDFAGTTPTGSEKVETAYGTGALGQSGEMKIVNIISKDNVFIFVSAPGSVSSETLKSVAHSLTQ